jgi:hypothetical protein
MSAPEQSLGRSEEPGRYPEASIAARCWLCSAPNPSGSDILGGSKPGGGGTRIAVCASGEGCKDGRIFHGPQADLPHYPDEDCRICGVAGQPRAMRHNAGPRGGAITPAVSRDGRPR